MWCLVWFGWRYVGVKVKVFGNCLKFNSWLSYLKVVVSFGRLL